MITWRCWSKTLSALLATSKIVTFATRLNTSQGRINNVGPGKTRQEVINEMLNESPAERDARQRLYYPG